MADYDTIAAGYESRVVPKFRPIAERLAALAGLGPGDHVLELGAGTGGLSRLVVPRIEPGGLPRTSAEICGGQEELEPASGPT